MATDETGIYNLALSELGSRTSVADPNEASREAELCKLWYTNTVHMVLRAAPWPCATAYKRLGLLKARSDTSTWATDDPEPPWLYAYGAPNDIIRPRYLTSYERFRLSTYSSSAAVMCNNADPVLVYTKQELVVSRWDSQLQLAIAYALAGHVAMGLTGKAARAQRVVEAANNLILQARESAANEDDEPHETLPDWLSARGATVGTPTRYIHPNGPLISVMGAVSVE